MSAEGLPGQSDFVVIRNIDIYNQLLDLKRDQAELKSEFKLEQRSLKTTIGVLSIVVMPLFSALIGYLTQLG